MYIIIIVVYQIKPFRCFSVKLKIKLLSEIVQTNILVYYLIQMYIGIKRY